MNNFPRYDSYKDSGVDWLGEVPEHWKVVKLKYVLKEINIRSATGEEELLSLSKYKGVVPKSELEERAGQAQTLIGYKIVNKENLVINKMQAANGIIAVSKIEGITSPDYSIYESIEKSFVIDYYGYLLVQPEYLAEYKKVSTGVMEGYIRLYSDDLFKIQALFPPSEEQKKIIEFLDRKTAQIEQAIAQKERLIELLKEHRQILIHKAVTRGLNPNVKLNHSGLDWIGEIPEHWEIKRLKYLLNERNERSETGDEPLFMVSQTYGLVVRADHHEKADVAQSNIGNKKVHRNDLVFNKLKAHLGVFYKSNIDFVGIVSPDYAVYYPIGEIEDLKFLELLFRHPAYIAQFISKATGIVEGLIRLYTSDLFSLEVPVPPKDEQKDILDFIEKVSVRIETAISCKQKEIEKLKEYKAVLINSAVTGKIKVCGNSQNAEVKSNYAKSNE